MAFYNRFFLNTLRNCTNLLFKKTDEMSGLQMNTACLAIISNITVSGAFEDHCLKTISIRLEFFIFYFI